ncbi:hypothetical protein C5Y96_09680 [Blastopirellula marina]|uniref:Cytochrome c domain-containing protein n=1 Tax=Blastopirellula marina TaxID=124 RepID=A0A2S8FTX3_9BACT|nr:MULTISPECIES: hypothetical protein [Pirellulaceae]PQO35294.1 hypothetical protein C5Y96_09680 [Blastopirellula marina]RCS53163.1 hypothetical protein DTL36_09690 [Bremerella cremea]
MRISWKFMVAAMVLTVSQLSAQEPYDEAPINYSDKSVDNPIARIQEQLDEGQQSLEFDQDHGFLKSVLKALDISPESQVLVYSKSSFQLQQISPRRPRALYFNDDSYVGWVQRGDVLEIMTTDPVRGEVFYTLEQQPEEKPRFVRDQGQCTVCHASSRTQRVPGGLVRSMFVMSSGMPHYGAGTFNTDQTSPLSERWGGWYVTGTHGKIRHMGNVVSTDRYKPEEIDREAGANVTDLSQLFPVEKYVTPHSDIVALMVLEHQLQMQNYLTLASHEARRSAHHDQVMNEALERPADHISETTARRVQSAGDKVVSHMLMADEAPLEDAIAGTSRFAEEFQVKGPKDSQGRSLRDLDLKTRLFKYPCSYMIYSKTFDELPLNMKSYIARRLREVLAGEDASGDFDHLTRADRQAISEILQETKPELWKLGE